MSDTRLPLGKECSKCGDWNLLEDFPKDKRNRDGRTAACKDCASAYKKRYMLANRETLQQQRSAYYLANKERELAYQRERYYADPDGHRADARARYQRNRERYRESQRVSRSADPSFPARHLRHVHVRRARLMGAAGSYSQAEWDALARRTAGAACGAGPKRN